MTRIDAGKLLGGYATGTLTEAERTALFAAALEHQELFNALADEEALRELLADPAAKAQLLAALAPAAAPKVVPFWRRTGVLGAAASLLVASLAGLAYLRSPEQVPPSSQPEAAKAPAAKAAPAPAAATVAAPAPPAALRTRIPAEKAKEATTPLRTEAAAAPPPPAPQPQVGLASAGGAAPAAADAARDKADAYQRAAAQDNLARKDSAPRPAAALVEVLEAPAPVAKKAKAEAPRAVPGGMVGGVVGGVVGGGASVPPKPAAPAASARLVEAKAAAATAPTWTLESRPDGATRIRVKGPAGAHAVLLRRNAAGVEALALKVLDRAAELASWSAETRLAAGDVLDLYLLNGPVAEPANLPETGPVDGFRARIHPAAK